VAAGAFEHVAAHVQEIRAVRIVALTICREQGRVPVSAALSATDNVTGDEDIAQLLSYPLDGFRLGVGIQARHHDPNPERHPTSTQAFKALCGTVEASRAARHVVVNASFA
jgi:hypothetical protein